MVFTIDNSRSQVAADGIFAGSTFTAQGAGALTTSYSGSINADIDNSTIQFTGGSAISAQTGGNWKPGVGGSSGSAPAAYGPKATVSIFTVYGAVRNFVLDLTSPVLNVSGGGFDGGGLVFSIASTNATLDYDASITSGSYALNGYGTNAIATGATLSVNGSTQTLVIPVDTTYYFTLLSANDSHVHLTGQLVATAGSVVAAAPIIHSLTFSNQNVVVTAENATTQSQLLVSTNLATWSPASATTTTNGSGWIIFIAPKHGPQAFFQVQQ